MRLRRQRISRRCSHHAGRRKRNQPDSLVTCCSTISASRMLDRRRHEDAFRGLGGALRADGCAELTKCPAIEGPLG